MSKAAQYHFRGVVIKVYPAKGRFIAHYPGPGGIPLRVERATTGLAVEAAKERIREMHDPEVQQVLLEEKAATAVLEGTGVTVIEAARVVASYHERLKVAGGTVGDAIQFFLKAHEGIPITVAELVIELLAAKATETGVHNVRDLRSRLKHQFCREYGTRVINSIRADELKRWIVSRPGNQRSRRNHHAALVTLFNFGQEMGYLPKDRPNQAALNKKPKASRVSVQIFTPEEFTKLITAALELISRALAALLIQGLSAVRHEELEQTDPKKDRARWKDVRLDQQVPDIHIRDEVSKLGKERFVPLHASLVAWLRLLRLDDELPIYPMMSLTKDYARICRKVGIAWKKNGLRKSFITYDAALSGSVLATAEGAGNSPEMIGRYYNKPVSQVGPIAVKWLTTSPAAFVALLSAYLAATGRKPMPNFTVDSPATESSPSLSSPLPESSPSRRLPI